MSRSVLAEHVAAWLRKARRDLEAAEWDLSAATPFLDDAVFHSQQAAEKALKGFLTARDVVFTKTHDIGELAQPVIAEYPEMEPLLRRASSLTAYAWRYRYPGEPPEPSRQEANQAVEIARELLAAIEERVV